MFSIEGACIYLEKENSSAVCFVKSWKLGNENKNAIILVEDIIYKLHKFFWTISLKNLFSKFNLRPFRKHYGIVKDF